jgi:transposase
VFLDESGFQLQPLRRRTWAPRGQTPVLRVWDRRDRISAIAAVSLAPRNLRIGLYFQLLSHNVRTDDGVAFIRTLRRQLRRPLLLVLDRYSVHRAAVQRLQAEGATWLRVEWLPAYAPELDPVEYVWNHTKYTDLANFAPDDVATLDSAIRQSLHAQRRDSWLKHSYFRSAKLAV